MTENLETKDKSSKRNLMEKIGEIFYTLIGIVIFIVIITVSVEEMTKDQEKIVAVEIPGDRYIGMKIVECRYPFGSIFNKDEMTIGSNVLVITTHSIWGSNTKTVPYGKIKEVELAEGMYWKSFTVRGEGFWGIRDTIYFKENLTKDAIRGAISAVAPEMIVIEKQTLAYRIREFLDTKKPSGEKQRRRKK